MRLQIKAFQLKSFLLFFLCLSEIARNIFSHKNSKETVKCTLINCYIFRVTNCICRVLQTCIVSYLGVEIITNKYKLLIRHKNLILLRSTINLKRAKNSDALQNYLKSVSKHSF